MKYIVGQTVYRMGEKYEVVEDLGGGRLLVADRTGHIATVSAGHLSTRPVATAPVEFAPPATITIRPGDGDSAKAHREKSDRYGGSY